MLMPLKPLASLQRVAAEHRGRAAEERGVPFVEPALDDAVEHLVLGRHALEGAKIALERVRVDEEVRRLDEEELLVIGEVTDGPLQKVPGRRVVGIEHRHQFSARMGKAVVEVAGLGVKVARAGEIVDAHVGAELGQLLAAAPGGNRFLDLLRAALLVGAAVIEEPDGHAMSRIVDRLGRGERRRQQARVLVVGGNEDVDGRERRRPRWCAAAGQWLGNHEEAQKEHENVIDLSQIEEDRGNEVL